MANQGAKKRKEENRKHMANLLRLIIASNVRSPSRSLPLSPNIFFPGFSSLIPDLIQLRFLSALCESQIPAFGAYKVVSLLKGTLGGSEGEVEDEKSRKKREKMEKKASRGKIIKTRNR
ncbi:hypothetical protein BHE74_00013228 [Ensete ventricosum]|nr:hypothetical protein GW17_00019841 [Ensete ventricosum]RWW78550.1 hypothetical protein BHE74_00013228 [Ensete ventricosum]RZR82710.1 hypothetical protein BHM03_00009188 [Ensete ventricosum]